MVYNRWSINIRSDIRVLRLKAREIPETMVCKILSCNVVCWAPLEFWAKEGRG